MPLQWFAVRIRPQQRTVSGARFDDPATAPFITELQLQRRGFRTFLPRRTVFRHANGVTAKQRKKREVARPLLVGWIFVGWPHGQNRWRELFDCPGVVGVAGCEGVPARVDERALEAFARRFGGGLIAAPARERFMRTGREFKPGDTVQGIAGSALEDVSLKVIDMKHGQAKVLLEMFGQEREVWVNAWLIEPAKAA